MTNIFTQIAQFISAMPASASNLEVKNPAQSLMESAGARAGSHPYQAAELRSAASAYLSVVR